MRDPEAVDVDGAMSSREAKSPVLFAGLILDLDACTLARESGETVQLTRGEFALLRFFASHPRRVLSRDILLDATAGRRLEPFDRSVDAMMVGRSCGARSGRASDPKAPSRAPSSSPYQAATSLPPCCAERGRPRRPNRRRRSTARSSTLQRRCRRWPTPTRLARRPRNQLRWSAGRSP